MIATNVRRPRNVDMPRAAAILYGDLGTSKAYVIGLGFTVPITPPAGSSQLLKQHLGMQMGGSLLTNLNVSPG